MSRFKPRPLVELNAEKPRLLFGKARYRAPRQSTATTSPMTASLWVAQRLRASRILSRFSPARASPDRSVEQQEEDAANGLAGWADFREFRFKGVAGDLFAGTERNVIGRSV